VTKVVDPLAGSYYVESLTNELIEKAWALIEEVEEMGGMTKAVESGMPKLRIEEAPRAAGDDRPRRGGDRRRQQVPQGHEDPIDILDRSTTSPCAKAQIARLEKIRAARDEAACTAALDELERARGRAATFWRRRSRRPGRGPVWERSAWRWKRCSDGTAPR
jgi:methylmalonyl-CoA mutase